MTDTKQTEATNSSEKKSPVKNLKKEDLAAKDGIGKTSLINLSLILTLLLSMALGLAALTASYFLWQKINDELFVLLGSYCGKTADKVKKDATRDFWLNAEEAKKYGIIDEIIKPKK